MKLVEGPICHSCLDPKELNISILGNEVKAMKDFSVGQLDF